MAIRFRLTRAKNTGTVTNPDGGSVDLTKYYLKTETYNRTEIDGKVHTHTNKSVLDKFSEDVSGKPLYNGAAIGGATGTTDLSNYYDKTEVYNKNEVDTKIANIPTPEADLTDYYDKEQVQTLLAQRSPIDHTHSEFTQIDSRLDVLEAYDDTPIKDDISALDTRVDALEAAPSVEDVYLKPEMDTKLEDYALNTVVDGKEPKFLDLDELPDVLPLAENQKAVYDGNIYRVYAHKASLPPAPLTNATADPSGYKVSSNAGGVLNLFDGDTTALWSSTKISSGPSYVLVELPVEKTIGGISVYINETDVGYTLTNYEVQVSLDGTTYTTALSSTDPVAIGQEVVVEFPGVNAKFVKFIIKDTQSTSDYSYAHMHEFKVIELVKEWQNLSGSGASTGGDTGGTTPTETVNPYPNLQDLWVYLSANYSVASGQYKTVPYNTLQTGYTDPLGMFNATTGAITIKEDGIYTLDFRTFLQGINNTAVQMNINIGGTQYRFISEYVPAGNGTWFSNGGSWSGKLTAGTVVTVETNVSTSGVAVMGGNLYSWLKVTELVRATP